MENTAAFITPKIGGIRFENNRIPLEVLQDLSALQDIILELAKDIYRQENQRTKIPEGFTEGVSLELAQILKGSACPETYLHIVGNQNDPLNIQKRFYLQKAKDRVVQILEAAESGSDEIRSVPLPVLRSFEKLGKHLREDEFINFAPAVLNSHAVLNAASRRVIRQAREYTELNAAPQEFRGLVRGVEQGKRKFTFKPNLGSLIELDLPARFTLVLIDALKIYRQKGKVKITGNAVLTKDGRLKSFQNIDNIEILNPLDIVNRIEELSLLKIGWNGRGTIAPKTFILSWVRIAMQDYFDNALPLPKIFPTNSGGLDLEWSTEEYDISLTIDNDELIGYYHSLNLVNDTFEEKDIDLSNEAGWTQLNDLLKQALPYE